MTQTPEMDRLADATTDAVAAKYGGRAAYLTAIRAALRAEPHTSPYRHESADSYTYDHD
jgi:hypothetical protein